MASTHFHSQMEAALQLNLVHLDGARLIAFSRCIIPKKAQFFSLTEKKLEKRHLEKPTCILHFEQHYRNWEGEPNGSLTLQNECPKC